MFNFKSMLIPKNLTWFARSLNAFLVEFPNEITPDLLKQETICSKHDSEEAYEALK
ncbi:MAG: hypothetical protein K0S55_1424 [Clostridia bacterium]|nr:hypothetical protein [Clostridia bacterium]